MKRERLPGSRSISIVALAFVVASVLAVSASAARSDATPVGALPRGPLSTIETHRGLLVAVALPRQKARSGLVWRLARRVDTDVVQQLSEGDIGSTVVVVFKVVGSGRTSIVFALTRGEASRKALRSQTTRVVAS